MISFKEALGKNAINDLPIAHQQNLQELLKRVNVIRLAYAKPMIVTSGYRSMQQHLAIYAKKGIKDRTQIPMASKHLSGRAIDIADPKQDIQAFILANIQLLIDNELWCEDFSATKNWVHIQSVPPKSGKRFFMP